MDLNVRGILEFFSFTEPSAAHIYLERQKEKKNSSGSSHRRQHYTLLQKSKLLLKSAHGALKCFLMAFTKKYLTGINFV